MAGDLLFIRKAELIIGTKVAFSTGPVVPVDARFFRTRLNFTVTKNESGNANKAKISIYNISPDSKTFLEQDDLVVFLNAGYESGAPNLFFGDLQRFNEKRSGADIITTLECGDSEKTLQDANIQIGLGPGATNRQIIDAAIKQLSLAQGFLTEIPLVTYQSGFSFSGPIKKLMNDQMSLVDLKWSIQDGELQILEKDGTDQQFAVELSQTSGLIGSPTKTKNGVDFISLLNAAIRPGRAVILNSKRYLEGSGARVKVTKTTHSGDTHQGKWQVKCEGVVK